MKLDEIKKLIEFLQDTDITEFQVEKEGEKFKIKREKFFAPAEAAQPVSGPSTAAVEAAQAAPEEQNFIIVTAPIVGIFYTAPSPESPPFVKVGSSVKKGQVMCIVEAMKLMNEIECDTDGTILKILVENGQPVEYGEPLFHIEPAL